MLVPLMTRTMTAMSDQLIQRIAQVKRSLLKMSKKRVTCFLKTKERTSSPRRLKDKEKMFQISPNS